ncbi:MAG: hypothetical protein KAJ19_25150 [Gammaproteobacteria bacterium]|nr:hypothetical protein [Gammaproteobacteria bacterium]
MSNEQNESELNNTKHVTHNEKNTQYITNLKNNYFESAFFIATITSSLYYFGYTYYNYFFSRLSIPLKFLNVSVEDYIIIGLQPILLLFGFFFASFIVWSKPPKNILRSFIGNSLLFIFIIIGIYVNWVSKNYLSIGMYIIFLILTIQMTIQKRSFAYDFYKGDWNLRFLVIIIVLFGILMFANFSGNSDAEELIKGSSKNSLEIQLMLKDNNNTQFQNETLILIMLQNNNYYIMEKDETAPKNPKLYIIPSNQVEMAIISKVNKN